MFQIKYYFHARYNRKAHMKANVTHAEIFKAISVKETIFLNPFEIVYITPGASYIIRWGLQQTSFERRCGHRYTSKLITIIGLIITVIIVITSGLIL